MASGGCVPNVLAERARVMSDFELERTCFACPMQYSGKVDGYPLYFRLRHGRWSFTIAEKNAVWPGDDERFYDRSERCDDKYDGLMPEDEAIAIIERCVAQFRERGFDD